MWDGLTIGQFFCALNIGYIIRYFDKAMSLRQFSGEALANKVQLTVLNDRRHEVNSPRTKRASCSPKLKIFANRHQ